jgi:hypothetical protein
MDYLEACVREGLAMQYLGRVALVYWASGVFLVRREGMSYPAAAMERHAAAVAEGAAVLETYRKTGGTK